ncbi:hypothetical protein AB0O67_28965 [Streptomyces sp. NPDC086077]|uniref:hypothetical protein n=1 Tax=Streptomyces sp. NPDC086077 TaxID=3154862 RepID=UPI00343F2793
MKMDPAGSSIKHWLQMSPIFGSEKPGLPWPSSPRAHAFNILALCQSGCTDANKGFDWETDRSPTWSGGLDDHIAQGNAETSWDGSVANAAGTKDRTCRRS